MPRQEFESGASVDAKTAERALEMAVQLQRERGELVSVDELHRTAAEAGIAPELVAEALKKIEAEKQMAEYNGAQRRLGIIAIASGLIAASLALLLTLTHFHDNTVLVIGFVVAIVVMRRIRRSSGGYRNSRW
jgi:hypothetical protein